jgi:hypothetical protein
LAERARKRRLLTPDEFAAARFLVIIRAQPNGQPLIEYGLEAPVPEKPGAP